MGVESSAYATAPCGMQRLRNCSVLHSVVVDYTLRRYLYWECAPPAREHRVVLGRRRSERARWVGDMAVAFLMLSGVRRAVLVLSYTLRFRLL